jgi:hypothetical protein
MDYIDSLEVLSTAGIHSDYSDEMLSRLREIF